MRRTMLVALIGLALGTTAAGAHAQEVSRVPGAKSPTVARIVGIVPGAGHIYAGETSRGLGYMGAVAGGFMLASLALAAECYDDLLGDENNCGESTTTEDIAVAALLGVWAWSIYDAGRAAHRTNAKRRLGLSPIIAPARVSVAAAHERPALKLGLSVRAR